MGRLRFWTIYAGLCLAAVSLPPALLEGWARWRDRAMPVEQKLQFELKAPTPADPTTVTRQEFRLDGKTVFSVDYAIDENGLRVTPLPDRAKRDRYLLFFGCSFAFGEGVAGGETLPYRTAEALPGHRAYNLGVRGYGPHNVLAGLEEHDVSRDLRGERRGAVVYVWIDDQLRRVAGSARYLSWYGTGGPFYRLDERGRPAREGTFATARPWATPLLAALGRAGARSRFIRGGSTDAPLLLYRSAGAWRLSAKLIAAVRDRLAAQLGGARFVVVIMPGELLAPKRLAPLLRAEGVTVLDYSELFAGLPQDELRIPVDRHPSAEAYRRIGLRLAADLKSLQ